MLCDCSLLRGLSIQPLLLFCCAYQTSSQAAKACCIDARLLLIRSPLPKELLGKGSSITSCTYSTGISIVLSNQADHALVDTSYLALVAFHSMLHCLPCLVRTEVPKQDLFSARHLPPLQLRSLLLGLHSAYAWRTCPADCYVTLR